MIKENLFIAPTACGIGMMPRNPNVIEEANFLAKKREKFKRQKGVAHKKFDKSASIQFIDAQSFESEVYWCQLRGLDPRKYLGSYSIIPGQDDGWDVLYHGKRIQIKSTKYPNGALMWGIAREIRFDMIVLMIVCDNYAKEAGYLTAAELASYTKTLKPSPRAKYYPAIEVPQHKLHPREWLEEHCKHGDEWLQWWLKESGIGNNG